MDTQGLTASAHWGKWQPALGALVIGAIAGATLGTAVAGARLTSTQATQAPAGLSQRVGAGTPQFAAAHATKPSTASQRVGAGTPQFAAAHATKPSNVTSSAIEKATRRSLIVLIPGDRDYVGSSRIAIAGLAPGRPHGVRIRTVQAELLVAGKVVGRTDLEVSSGRFAGFLELPARLAADDAELRVTDVTLQSGPAVVQGISLDAR